MVLGTTDEIIFKGEIQGYTLMTWNNNRKTSFSLILWWKTWVQTQTLLLLYN
jgi:hypothetical protein